jgi:hypothetical protein
MIKQVLQEKYPKKSWLQHPENEKYMLIVSQLTQLAIFYPPNSSKTVKRTECRNSI